MSLVAVVRVAVVLEPGIEIKAFGKTEWFLVVAFMSWDLHKAFEFVCQSLMLVPISGIWPKVINFVNILHKAGAISKLELL